MRGGVSLPRRPDRREPDLVPVPISADDINRQYEAALERINGPGNEARRSPKPPVVTVGMEGAIAWGALFGFEADDFFGDPWFSTFEQLREKVYHLDNFDDDSCFNTDLQGSIGWYTEYTVLGMPVSYEPRGVPIIETAHPLTRTPDLSLVPEVDFRGGGDMPKLLRLYETMLGIADGRWKVGLWQWNRGPLDLAIQIRGYEAFVMDTMERPGFASGLMQKLTDARIAWYEGYAEYTGQRPDGGGIGDDWLNVPFITPAMFDDFILPYYAQLEAYHGKLWGVHSCGNQAPIQKSLLTLTTLGAFECSPWTDLEVTCANIPPDKHIVVALHNARDVLVCSEDWIHENLGFIKRTCEGRPYSVVAGGLQKIHDDYARDIGSIQRFLAIAREVFGK
jgi:hypothetical protein